MKNSFYNVLRKHGYTKEEANSICISIENDLTVPESVEDLYWTWWNNVILQKGDEL